jgi:TetR/AcrR family transcriptional regulator
VSRSRSLDTRNKILEVAEREFATYGYSGAHLQAIAEQVGVQKTALYYYFPSKSGLYNAVLQQMLETLRDTVERGVAAPGSHAERFEALLGELNDLLAERHNYSKILFRIFVDRSPFDLEAAGPLVEDLIGRILVFYRSGVDAGEFRRLSARHLFMSLMGTVFFHYASDRFAAEVLGVDDVFTSSVVSWRRQELLELMTHGVIAAPGKPDGGRSGSEGGGDGSDG